MRIGFLGMAHLHIDSYLAKLRARDVVIVGVTDEDPERGKRWADRNGVTWHADRDAMFAAGVDAVIVCSETARHLRDVEAAAAAGTAVLCEKPLATNEQEAREIVDVCARAGVPLMTAFPMRYSPPIANGAQMIADGGLGRVWAVQGVNQSVVPMRHRSWFVDPAESGGGAIMDHVVHIADILRWYLDADPIEVYAQTNRIRHGDVVPVETAGLLMLTYADGTFASIDFSWSRPDEYPTWGGLGLELVGEQGVVSIDGFSQRLTIHGGPEGPLGWPGWGSDADQGLIDDLIDVVANGSAPKVTGEDGLAATRIALAALQSAREGRPVALQPTA